MAGLKSKITDYAKGLWGEIQFSALLYFYPIIRLCDRRSWKAFFYEFNAQNPPTSLRSLTRMVGTWTTATFVDAGRLGACNHIKDEAGELIELMEEIKAQGYVMTPEQKYKLGLELADILILSQDIAYANNIDLTDFVILKHVINMQRKWAPPDERGVQHHIEPELDPDLKSATIDRSEEEIKRLKTDWKYGKEKLAAVLATPDPVIANAVHAFLNQQDGEEVEL